MSPRRSTRFTVYRFFVRLCGFDPAIWRVVGVADCILDELLQALLVSLGWRSERSLRCTALADPCPALDPLCPCDWPLLWISQILEDDEASFRLRCELGRDDAWRFEVVYHGASTSAEGAAYPLCLAGERAGVPDDTLEPQTLRAFLAALAHPGHPQHTAVRRWFDYDPAELDVAEVNRELARLCRRQNPIDECGPPFRVRVTDTERTLFFEHARVNGLAFDWLRKDAPAKALRVFGPDAGAAARSLALAANQTKPGKARRQLERMAGRFYRCALAHRERVMQMRRAQQQPVAASMQI
jgi:hypothetical protein